jgi:hypothetical protein
MKIIRTYLYVNCNKKIYLLKYQPIVGNHRLLHSSCCFLNTNTAITRQLIRTSRTLEAEWWQVCGDKGRGVKYWERLGCWISPCYGPFWLGARFETYEPFIFLVFQIFFRVAVNRGYGDPPVCIQYVHNRALHKYINVCMYTHPYCELLHHLCSWTGYGSESHREEC